MLYEHVKHTDPELYDALILELNRQRNKIELIASENFVNQAVLEAQGSILRANMRKAILTTLLWRMNTSISRSSWP